MQICWQVKSGDSIKLTSMQLKDWFFVFAHHYKRITRKDQFTFDNHVS